MAVLLAILGISFLIFIHEFGHFLCARIARVRVHVFSLGFGPRLWGFRRGDTDYRLSAVPLGGYVQVAGDDPTANRDHLGENDLCSKSFSARLFFYVGGVAMNLLFALVAFPLVFNTGVMFDAPVLGGVDPGGPAWEAGLQAGDEIVEIDGKEIYQFPNIDAEAALSNTKHGMHVVYERDGARGECTVFPRYSKSRGMREMAIVHSIAKGPFPIEVDAGSAEEKAGLRNADRLLSFNGIDILTYDDWRRATRDYQQTRLPAGQTEVTLRIRRPLDSGDAETPGAGSEHVIRCTPRIDPNSPARIGVAPAEVLVAGVRNDNEDAERLGIRRGDRILFVDGQPFRGGDLAFATAGDTVEVTVKREDIDAPVVLRAKVTPERRAALSEAIAIVSDMEGGPVVGTTVRPIPGSPAHAAGIATGDVVQVINGTPVKTWDELVAQIRSAVTERPDQPIAVTFLSAEGIRSVELTAKRDPTLGFALKLSRLRTLFQTESFGGALRAGWIASWDFVKQVYLTLKRLFSGEVSPSNLSGIITISRVSYAFAQEGMARLFYFLAILSINLAIINVLPIPVLDGGHLMFLLIERIKGSPVSTKVHNYSQILGLVFVLALMVYVTYNDILKLSFFS